MRPVLFRIGTFPVHSYGLMLALALLLGLWLAVRRGRKAGIPSDKMMDVSVYGIIVGILGARLLYVVFHWHEFSTDPLSIINPFGPGRFGIAGLILYGGLITGLVFTFFYFWKQGIPLWKGFDVLAPSVALGIFFVRIGCYLNGCCFGEPSHLPWSVVFPKSSPAGWVFPDTSIHPTQLYSALYGMAIFGSLLYFERFKRFDGFTFWLFIMLYSVARFLIDFLRYYEDNMVILRIGETPILFNQGISMLSFLVAAIMLLRLNRSQRIRAREAAETGL
ncbi:MAG TPA: prolipoprotein diacylglyceryl transferase [Candidatus Latescibacteria bacterium]|nr:prolipoprotein diacylglyceryl transferase [Candidatus Latescibacterota bacterium]